MLNKKPEEDRGEESKGQNDAFDRLKKTLVQPLILVLPLVNRQYMIYNDEIQYTVGVILLQHKTKRPQQLW